VNGSPAPLRANPPSGSQIVSLDDTSIVPEGSESTTPQRVFNSFSPAEAQYLRYSGYLIGENICLPFICKSFHPDDENGWQEARHALFLGRSGSGKTHAAKIMLATYLLSTPRMGAFIPDGKGDFIRPSRVDLDLRAFLQANGRNVEVITLEDLRLEEKKQFEQLLEIENLKSLIIGSATGDKWQQLLELTLARFTDENGNLIAQGEGAITLQAFLDGINQNIRLVYAESQNALNQRVARVTTLQGNNQRRIREIFDSVLNRFTGGILINDVVDAILSGGQIYFLDIQSFENEVNVYILGTLYRRFRKRSSYLFNRRTYSNAIVYVDEANRFIPQNPDDDRKELARELIDGIRTTRQYGLAWWFADQRPASISKDAFTQMRTYFFGKGMNAVADRASMESVLGEDGCNIYDYVVTTGGRPFVVTGQFVGIGSSDYVPVPIEFFGNWQELADNNNRDFATRILSLATTLVPNRR
jgi:DNA helicase HerA-like ATPase